MNNTTISILVALGLFGVIAFMVFQDEGPPKLDFQEIVSEEKEVEEEDRSTSTEGVVDVVVDESNTATVEESVAEEEASVPEEAEDTPTNEPISEEPVVEDENSTQEEVVEEESATEEVGATSTEEADVPEEEVVVEEEVVTEEPIEAMTPPSDFVMHLLFDETTDSRAGDATGHGNYGTLVNTDPLISWIDGQINGGLFLDGQNDYVGISHSETLNLGAPSQGYTISFWFRTNDEPGSEVQIIGKGGRSGPSPFSIRLNRDGEPSFRVSDGISATTLQLDKSVTNGSWKHITAVREGDTKRLKMYIDGISYGGLVYDTSTQSMQNSSAVLLNRYESGLNQYRYHNFALDDLRIYNRALGAEEILGIVNDGRI